MGTFRVEVELLKPKDGLMPRASGLSILFKIESCGAVIMAGATWAENKRKALKFR